MSMSVLQDKSQIENARSELVRRNLSALDSPARALLRKLRLGQGPSIGDRIKSWDVLETVRFLEGHVPRDNPVLDIGAYASEILIALYRAGYQNLAGVDLNPRVRRMLHADSIRYEVSDFLNTPFADGSFAAITSISVIEHGFQPEPLLREMSRLLRPGGYFIASFDYWPHKIDTSSIKFFGMDWLIFSEEDVRSFVAAAANYGLSAVGDLSFAAAEKPIDCVGKSYTFGWLVLRKAG